MVKRRQALAFLPRKRLLEVGERLGISGLSGRTKDQIIESIAAKRSIKIGQLLELFRLEELKAACLKAGLDGGGRSKGELIARLLNDEIGSQGMAKKSENGKRKIEQYDHKDKTRANNPPVGLVTPKTDPDQGKKPINTIRTWTRSLSGQGRPSDAASRFPPSPFMFTSGLIPGPSFGLCRSGMVTAASRLWASWSKSRCSRSPKKTRHSGKLWTSTSMPMAGAIG